MFVSFSFHLPSTICLVNKVFHQYVRVTDCNKVFHQYVGATDCNKVFHQYVGATDCNKVFHQYVGATDCNKFGTLTLTYVLNFAKFGVDWSQSWGLVSSQISGFYHY